MTGFSSEKALTAAFLRSLKTLQTGRASSFVIRREVKGLFGVPDVLLALVRQRDRMRFRAISFELKLANWRHALMQAYRYAAFSDYSFVVLDESAADKAIASLELFHRSNIGLITVSRPGKLNLHFRPKARRPYCPSTRAKLEFTLRQSLESGSRCTTEKVPFESQLENPVYCNDRRRNDDDRQK